MASSHLGVAAETGATIPLAPTLPPVEQTITERRISGAYPPDRWLAYLGELAGYLQNGPASGPAPAKGTGFAWRWLIAIIIAITGFGAALVSGIWFFGFVGLALAGLLLIVIPPRKNVPLRLSWKRPGERERTLIMERINFLKPLLAVLREELRPGQTVELSIDLRPTQISEKRRLLSGNLTFYEDPWLQGHTLLGDGSSLAWVVSGYVRERTRTKRSRSGRMKTKRKYKSRTVLDVRLGLRRDDYNVEHMLTRIQSDRDVRVTHKAGEKRVTFRLRRSFISFTATPTMPSPRQLFLLISTVYRTAQPAAPK